MAAGISIRSRTRRAGAFAAWVAGGASLLPGRWVMVAAIAILLVATDAIAPATLDARVAWDARVYWHALGAQDPYVGARLGVLGSYLYSPAFLLLIAPAVVLPWPAFLFGWTILNGAAAVWLTSQLPSGARRFWPLIAAVVILELWAGNIHLLLAAAIVLGLRAPGAWWFVLLTKVTPGIGIAWFALRREWAALATAIVATVLVVCLSLVADPWAWPAWLDMLTSQGPPAAFALPLPLPERLAAAMLLLAWAAPRDRAWAIPVASVLALPAIWPISLVILVGAPIIGRVNRSS